MSLYLFLAANLPSGILSVFAKTDEDCHDYYTAPQVETGAAEVEMHTIKNNRYGWLNATTVEGVVKNPHCVILYYNEITQSALDLLAEWSK